METQSVSLDGSGRCNAQLGTTLPAGLLKDSFASGHGAIASGHSNPYMGCFQVQTTSASVSSRVRGAVGQNSPSSRCPLASSLRRNLWKFM